MSISIREAATDEHPVIVDLLCRTGLSAVGVRLDAGRYWIAVNENGYTAGVAGIEIQQDACLLRSLAVQQHYRRLGYGSLLVRHAKEEARRMGCVRMYAFSTGAGQFFLHCGFEPASVQEAAAVLSAVPQVVHYRTNGAFDHEQAWRTSLTVGEVP